MRPEDFLDESAVLKVSDLVRWKKSQQKYNFETLPATAILSLNAHLLDRKTRVLSKKAIGLPGKNFILKKAIFCADFGSGAPAIISLMEELRALGVTHFIFVGFAGWMGESAMEAGTFLAEKGFSSLGVTRFYAANDYFEPRKSSWFERLKFGLGLPKTISWSTDAPYRETPSMLRCFAEKGAKHLDMEAAAVYAYAQFYNLDALCLLVTADDLSSFVWKAPKDHQAIQKQMRKTIQKIIQWTHD